MGDLNTMRKNFPAPVLFTLTAMLALAGCSSSDDMTSPAPAGGQANLAVEVSAAKVAAAAPAADLGGDVAAAIVLQSGIALGQCDPTFDLGNGITGTCSEAPEGTFNFTFSGTTNLNGQNATVNGTMVAIAGANSTTIDLDATATSAGGSATIAVTGTVAPGSGGGLGAVSLTTTITVERTGQSAVNATIVLTPTGLSLSASNGGILVGISLNRATMTGTASVGGVVIANLSIVNGCAVLDFIDTATEDRTVCPD